MFEIWVSILEMSTDLMSHESIFRLLNYDYILNEFLWRANNNGLLQYHINQLFISHNYNNIIAFTNITSRGVYINIELNSNKLWHMSFHLHNVPHLSTNPPGAIHIQNNTNTSTKPYEITPLIEVYSICNQLNHIHFNRGQIFSKNPKYSMCSIVNDTINIVLNLLNNYFTQSSNPLSLYYNLSGNQQIVNPYLMPIIRTRVATMIRTSLTSHLVGGGIKHKSLKTLKYKKHANKKSRRNRHI